MRKPVLILCIACSILVEKVYSQNAAPGKFWNQQSFGGELRLSGLFREQKSFYDQMKEDQRSTYFLSGLRLNSRSYLWDADIISLDITGEFNPESRKEKYLQIPDRAEVRTLSNLDLRTTVFNNKSFTINAFGGINQSYFNREYLTNVRTNTSQYGGMATIKNKFLPLSLSYRKSEWQQKELQTDRTFSMNQRDIEGRITKSFGEVSNNELIYSNNRYHYTYYGMSEVVNNINRISLSDNIYFDKNKNYSITSYGSLYDQKGTSSFRKTDLIERAYFQFRRNLKFLGDYSFYRMEETQVLNQNRVSASLIHQLYESLTSGIFGEYSEVKQTVYNESNVRAGLNLNYTKKIPTGRLSLTYRYYHHWYEAGGQKAEVVVSDEEQLLSDTKITLLQKPYVKAGSVTVTDVTRTVIYQEGFDYFLVARGSFTEIQRIPGGLITNNQSVRLNYISVVPGSYGFEADNNTFSTSLLLFKNVIEIYYRGAWQKYPYMHDADFLVLNRYEQNVYGGRIDVKIAMGGVEYDNYHSNIIPYRRMRYFLSLNWDIKSRVILSANGNIYDYKFIDDNVNQLYSNISGKIDVVLTKNLRADFETGYLEQNGRNINLRLLTSRAELLATFRQLLIRFSTDMYVRKYQNSNFTFFGTKIELIRRF